MAVTKFFRLLVLICGECHFVIVDISHFDPNSPHGPAQTLGTTFHPPREQNQRATRPSGGKLIETKRLTYLK